MGSKRRPNDAAWPNWQQMKPKQGTGGEWGWYGAVMIARLCCFRRGTVLVGVGGAGCWLRVLGAPRAKADGRREARRWARFAAPISKIRTPGLKPPLVCAFEQAPLRQKGMLAPASSFFHVFPQWGCCWSHLPTADARLKCQQASNVLSGDAARRRATRSRAWFESACQTVHY